MRDKPGKAGFNVYKKCYEAGVNIKPTGDALIIAPPFVCEKKDIDEIINKMRVGISNHLKSWLFHSFWAESIYLDQIDQANYFNIWYLWFNIHMSSQYKFENHAEDVRHQSRVKLTDLLTRINQEKKIERNRNLALSVAAVSAVTVFGIILTL